jgi:hypothetical protein
LLFEAVFKVDELAEPCLFELFSEDIVDSFVVSQKLELHHKGIGKPEVVQIDFLQLL